MPPIVERAETSLQAFLFTDIVGSTALKRRLGDREGAAAIAAHDACFRACVARYGGMEQNNPGDGFFATFPVPSAALHCALAFQSGLQDMPVQARVGIHLGESVHVPAADDAVKLLGLAVDTAGRVMSLAGASQILITRHAFDSARQQVLRGPAAEPIVWCAHGAYDFKGLDEPIEIHEAGIEGIAPLAPPSDSPKARRTVSDADEETLGWRPAAGLEVPGRPGWRLEKELGEGGFGEVWLARSERTKEGRAFKFCFRADRLRSLKRELTLFRLLKETLGERPDIARLYDVKLDSAPYFLEMDYTPDGSLDRWAPEDGHLAAMSIEERATFVAGIAEALAAAHSVGVLHKDVKPSNVLVHTDPQRRPRPRLTDFGIGQLLESADLHAAQVTGAGFTETILLTDLGSRTGTRLYMAPEVQVGKPASIASDVYALGVLLYQMVVGDLSATPAQGWEKRVDDPLLREEIGGMIAGDPRDRPTSCALVAENLENLEARRRAREASEREAAAEARRARLLRVAGVAVALSLVLAVAGFVLAGVVESKRREAEDARSQTAAALTREQTAHEEAQAARDAKAVALHEVYRLADAKKVTDLLEQEQALWPVHPYQAPAMKAWLDRAAAVLTNRDEHEASLERLRRKATPYSEAERRRDHADRLERLDGIRGRLAATAEPPTSEAARAGWSQQRAAARQEVERLEASVAERGSWAFESDTDDWHHQVLSDLIADLDRLATTRAEVAQRHEQAATLAERSTTAYAAAWAESAAAIAASPRYGGLAIEPQVGLVPLGADPTSGLFEFAVLDTGQVPERDPASGRLFLMDDFALVLVLIPGGTYLQGAQRVDAAAPNYDPLADADESPVHPVTISPFFLSKYECTQAQWEALSETTPSRYAPGTWGGQVATRRNPVEQVSWDDCARWLARHNLVLPAAAQWEYAARAGTTTPWWCGRSMEELAKAANVCDAYCKAHGGLPSWQFSEDVNDGFLVTAPVGSLAPNPFGLHDVHGNVTEWCLDVFGPYVDGPMTDPVGQGRGNREYRGGSWNDVAPLSRSSNRSSLGTNLRSHAFGVRPARPLTNG